MAPPAETTEAEAVEALIPPTVILPLAVAPQVLAPFAQLTVAAGAHLTGVEFETLLPAAQAPTADPARRPAALDPVPARSAPFTMGQPERPVPAIPAPGAFALEFYCQRVAGVASRRLRWLERDAATMLQPFSLRVTADKPEDLFAKTTKKQAETVSKVRELPVPRKNYSSDGIGYIGKIAAGLMITAFLYSGSRLVSTSGRTWNNASDLSAPAESSNVARGIAPAKPVPAPTGTLARVKQAIADRASLEVADTFRGGMHAWTGSNGTPAGWAKHADGYMKTGELALFRPTEELHQLPDGVLRADRRTRAWAGWCAPRTSRTTTR